MSWHSGDQVAPLPPYHQHQALPAPQPPQQPEQQKTGRKGGNENRGTKRKKIKFKWNKAGIYLPRRSTHELQSPSYLEASIEHVPFVCKVKRTVIQQRGKARGHNSCKCPAIRKACTEVTHCHSKSRTVAIAPLQKCVLPPILHPTDCRSYGHLRTTYKRKKGFRIWNLVVVPEKQAVQCQNYLS